MSAVDVRTAFDSWTDVLAGLAFLSYAVALVFLVAGGLTEALVGRRRQHDREGRQ